MLTGAWAAGRVEGMDPDFDFVVAPYPVLEDGGLVVINADTRLSVNRASEHMMKPWPLWNFFYAGLKTYRSLRTSSLHFSRLRMVFHRL